MKYEITKRGVYGADGKALAIGDTVEVQGDKVPGWLVNKAEAVRGGKTAATNPAEGAEGPAGPFTVAAGAAGWFNILDAKGEKVGKGLRQEDADAFGALTEAEQAEFAAEHAKG